MIGLSRCHKNIIYLNNICEDTQENKKLTIIKVEEGKSLFFDGDRADFIFEIIEGISRASKLTSDGRRQVIYFGYRGTIIGMDRNRKYHYNCDAVTDLKVRIYEKAAFYQMVESNPQFCEHLLNRSVAAIDYMQEHFVMLGRKSASEKLAFFLCELMERNGEKMGQTVRLSVPMKRTDIADFLCLTLETVNRNLPFLRKNKIIQFSKSRVIDVLQPNKLKMLADQAEY